ncbi:MAG: AraC family transcriptional regulator [Bacteroidales bacterium]|nr:AraC family transcriptional regulator [Bacteroidales bacterium]
MANLSQSIILLLYIITIVYFVILGCVMLAQRGNPISMHGEQVAKQRMTRSVGIFMFVWAFDWLIYLTPCLLSPSTWCPEYDVCLLVTMMLMTPALFIVMHAIVQRQVNTLRWVCATAFPFLLLTLCYVMIPSSQYGRLPVHIASVLNVLFIIYLLIRHAKGYRLYVQRIKSEYSEISGKEIFWSWSCFAGFAIQIIVFLFYEYNWKPIAEIFYWALSIINAAYLCYCTCRQKPLDIDSVEEMTKEEDQQEEMPKEKNEEKAFYAIIEQKLESLCEEKFLFLEPDLTRETLCRRLSISSTYLKMYFRSRDLSFYQYINTLRAEYAYRLMQDNPDMPIRDVCELSGFRSQTTFRKMFVEVFGCLPSEVKLNKNNP